MSKSLQYKFIDPNAYFHRKNSDIPFRYIARKFDLVNIYGDYGIFTNPDRKKPFVIAMNLMKPV